MTLTMDSCKPGPSVRQSIRAADLDVPKPKWSTPSKQNRWACGALSTSSVMLQPHRASLIIETLNVFCQFRLFSPGVGP